VPEHEIVPVELGDGRTMLVEALGDPDPERRVSITDHVPFDGVAESIDAISTRIVDALKRAKPKRASVEFGLDLALEAGQLTSLLVKGSGTATIKIVLEWESREPKEANPNATG
jgi:hypothetical protein